MDELQDESRQLFLSTGDVLQWRVPEARLDCEAQADVYERVCEEVEAR